MADVLPIKQVWAILKEKVMQAAPRTKAPLILTDSVLLAFSFFIISPFKFHQIQHPGTVLNTELHEDFKTGITFRI